MYVHAPPGQPLEASRNSHHPCPRLQISLLRFAGGRGGDLGPWEWGWGEAEAGAAGQEGRAWTRMKRLRQFFSARSDPSRSLWAAGWPWGDSDTALGGAPHRSDRIPLPWTELQATKKRQTWVH